MDLTNKELHVVGELSHGFTRREIAERQYRSEAVIKKHVQHAMEKMEARNAVHLIAKCKDVGLIMLLLATTSGGFGADVDLRKGRMVRSFLVRGGRVRQEEV